MAQYTPEYIQAFQNLVTKTKSFALAATQQSAPTTQDQRATGRSKGCSWALSQSVLANQGSTGQTSGVQKATINSDTPIMRGVLTTMIRGAVMETPIITTQQSKGVALYQATQGAQIKAATYREELCQKLYLALGISKGQSVPIQVKMIKTHEEPYVIRKNPSMDIGHKKVPPERNLMRSLICFHCQKKGHYVQNCCTRHRTAKIESAQSTTPVTPANCFSVLEEETCISTTTVVPALSPKLLDTKEIKRRTFHANKIREIMTKIQKLPVKEQAKLKELLAPNPKFTVKESQATIKVATTGQANDIIKIDASNIVTTLKDETVDEGTRIAILEQVMPTSFTDGATLATILDTLKLKSIYFSMKNFVQVKFPLMHYRGQAEEEALLNSGATENFIDANTVKRLRLGTKQLKFQRPVYNVDGTPNKHGTITYACDLLV